MTPAWLGYGPPRLVQLLKHLPDMRGTAWKRSKAVRELGHQRSPFEDAKPVDAHTEPDDSMTIVVCTMDRPAILERTMQALDAQTDGDFDVVVVDDSRPPDAGVLRRGHSGERLRIVPGDGDGLSRARNQGWRAANTPWVVYLDDDVHPDVDWVAGLRAAMRLHPEAAVVSGPVGAEAVPGGDELVITVSDVPRDVLLSGSRVRPWQIGLTVAMAIRRTALEALDGYDERLGPGRTFPSAEDVDFNYRFLRAGGSAFVSTRPAARHVQWRQPPALGPHFRGYMIGWTGFALKHVRQGDLRGGAWLWLLGAEDVIRMAGSAVRRRSTLRGLIALYKLQGLVIGTVRGLRAAW